jgi:hypothetical protein
VQRERKRRETRDCVSRSAELVLMVSLDFSCRQYGACDLRLRTSQRAARGLPGRKSAGYIDTVSVAVALYMDGEILQQLFDWGVLAHGVYLSGGSRSGW